MDEPPPALTPIRITDTALQILRERVVAHPVGEDGRRSVYVDAAALLSLIDEAVAGRRRADIETLRRSHEAAQSQVSRLANVVNGLQQRVAVLERRATDAPSLADPPRSRDRLPRRRRD